MESELIVGERDASNGDRIVGRAGDMGDAIVSQLNGRWYEHLRRGRLYTFGISNTALVNANAIATGLTATAQPIIGLWNPSTAVELEVAMCIMHETTIANTAVASGGYMWVYSVGNFAITTGSSGINCRTLSSPGGSFAKAFACSTALTGLSNNLATLRPSTFYGINAAGPATAITQPQGPGVEIVDGTLVVPPGGVIGIMNQAATTTISVNAGIIWAEIPKKQ